jgi:hypothetical protein
MFIDLRACALVSSIVLAGCASMEPRLCASVDWYAAGVENALAGRPIDEPTRRTEGCETRRLAADTERYAAGYAAGLQEYCTLEGGLRAARTGGVYRNVCAADDESDFLTGYYMGALAPAP